MKEQRLLLTLLLITIFLFLFNVKDFINCKYICEMCISDNDNDNEYSYRNKDDFWINFETKNSYFKISEILCLIICKCIIFKNKCDLFSKLLSSTYGQADS